MTEKELDLHRDMGSGIAYSYECSEEDCDFEEDLYFHMDEEKPDTYDCLKCGAKNSMRRVFGNKKVIIPFQWGETEYEAKFNKNPSNRKRFY